MVNFTESPEKTSASEENNSKVAEKSQKVEKASASTNSTPSAQRNYSRTPFNSKNKKLTSSSATSEDDEPKPKRSRQSAASSAAAAAASEEPTSNSNGLSVSSRLGSSGPSSPLSSVKSPTKVGARNLLARTSQYLMDSNSDSHANQSELDVGAVSAKNRSIRASSLKFGFIGLGLMGQRLVKNLINSGHSVTIWNRTPGKCKEFTKAGATQATTPADVICASDITFSCLSDPHAVKEIVFGNCGVLSDIRSGKGYVELSTLDPDTNNDISEAIVTRGGRYLAASIISNGKQQAEEGNLTVVLAGDKTLFEDCSSCFEAMSNHTFYLGGAVGDASKMGLVISMLIGNMIGSLAESMALADRTGLSQKDLLEIFSLSPLNCATLLSKGKAMIEGGFPTEMPLNHMQKDLRLALQLAEEFEHPLPITASTNEVFKHAKHLGYSDHDVAAVYIRSRF